MDTADTPTDKPIKEKDILKDVAKKFQKAGFTQKDIAKGMGFTRETINKWLNS